MQDRLIARGLDLAPRQRLSALGLERGEQHGQRGNEHELELREIVARGASRRTESPHAIGVVASVSRRVRGIGPALDDAARCVAIQSERLTGPEHRILGELVDVERRLQVGESAFIRVDGHRHVRQRERVHATRLQCSVASENCHRSSVPVPRTDGREQLEPPRYIPPQLRLFDSHGDRTRIAQPFDRRDDRLPAVTQIDRPVQNERAGRGLESLDHVGPDGAERERLAERTVVLDPLDVRHHVESLAAQHAALDAHAAGLQRLVPGRHRRRRTRHKQRHTREGLGHAPSLSDVTVGTGRARPAKPQGRPSTWRDRRRSVRTRWQTAAAPLLPRGRLPSFRSPTWGTAAAPVLPRGRSSPCDSPTW